MIEMKYLQLSILEIYLKNLVRVKSSNVWAYGINVRKSGDTTGDVIAQFKGKDGGAGDIYILYDVPIKLYRRWVAAPSKGAFYWKIPKK